MAQLLITVGTDGVTDWIRTPDGQRHNLGPVSVLNFVKKLSRSARSAKQALDAFLREGSAMLKVNENQMWGLLAPRRARWATDGSFIDQDQRTGPRRKKRTMATLKDDLIALEKHLVALDKAATAGTPPEKMAEGHEILVRLAQKIKSPNQSNNATYYGLGAPKVHEVKDPAPTPTPPETKAATEPASVEGLAYDTYAENTALASDIITKAEATNAKIDQLTDAGKQFNASRAKADVYAVTSKVAGILRDVDLTVPWVQTDLQRLAARANELHGLFAPAKV